MKLHIFAPFALAQAIAIQNAVRQENSASFPLSFWPGSPKFRPIQDFFSGHNTAPQCPVGLPVTCTNSTPVENACCFESPGGIMLQTQFWDYYPAIGKSDSFTLHGLWPDNCDGSYEQFCDGKLNIQRGDIKRIVVDEFKDPALFAKIEESWKNFNGDDELLWVHEFNKHATCIKTIRPECYGDEYTENRNVYDFLRIAVSLYEKYPTFEFLAQKNIVPSLTDTYTRAEIAEALSSQFGGNSVYFKCNRFQALQEIWYFHNLQGPLTNEAFVQIPSMLDSNCPETGIKFLPKGFRPGPQPHPPKDDSGNIKLSGHPGCLISNGQWYTQGTCAKFRAKDLQFGGINLVSSKGVCGVSADGVFNCNGKNQRSEFQFDVEKPSGVVSYGGNSEWCLHEAGKHGSGKFAQVPIKLADGNCESFQIKLSD